MNNTAKKPLIPSLLLALCCLLAACGNPIFRDALLGGDDDGPVRTGGGVKNPAMTGIEYKYWPVDRNPGPAEAPAPGWNDPGWTGLAEALQKVQDGVAANSTAQYYLYYIRQISYVDSPPIYAKGLQGIFGHGQIDASKVDTIEYKYKTTAVLAMPEMDDHKWNNDPSWKTLVGAQADWSDATKYLWFAQRLTFIDATPTKYEVGLLAVYGADGSGKNTGYIWKGEAADHSYWDPPEEDWVYFNTRDKNIYVYDGDEWVVLVDGPLLQTNIKLTGDLIGPATVVADIGVNISFTDGTADTGRVDLQGYVWLTRIIKTTPPRTIHTLTLRGSGSMSALSSTDYLIGRFFSDEPIELKLDTNGALQLRDPIVGAVTIPIGTVEEFKLIGAAGNLDKSYIQTYDINFLGKQPGMPDAQIKAWTPVGTFADPFTGTFDSGRWERREIKYLWIDRPSADDNGVFGVISGTAKLANMTISSGSVKGRDNTGGLCGQIKAAGGLIESCTSAAEVSGRNNVGGLCGLSAGAIDKGANTGKITGTGSNVGGLCGTAYMISTSNNRGVVSGAENTGGVAGFLSLDGKITSGDNTGSVVGAKAAGGVVGRADGPGVITACNNEGNVSVPLTGPRQWTGGVAGFAGETVMVANRNAGTVLGETDVGGVAGRIENGSTIIASYNAGTVSGSSSVGGVCGYNSGGSVSACYNIGLLLGPAYGVTGQASGSVSGSSDNFYLPPGNDNDGAKPFGGGAGGWPEDVYGNEWRVGGSGTAGQYWLTLGQWAAPRVYPKLYWEK